MLYIYTCAGSIKETVLEISKFDGVLSSSVHVGNSDIVGEFVYDDCEQLLDTIVKIKHLESVEESYGQKKSSQSLLTPITL